MTQRRICFVDRITGSDTVLMSFRDPVASHAILLEAPNAPRGEPLEVLLLPAASGPQPASPGSSQPVADWLRANDPTLSASLFVKYRGVELWWQPHTAMLQCEAEPSEALLAAIIEFTHFEAALRHIEDEIAHGWTDLEADKDLAFDVNPKDLKRSDVVGSRMGNVLHRRIRFARIEPFLWAPGTKLTPSAKKLGEELRERAGFEARIETVESQLEVFEHVYEMGSQRMGEARAAYQTQIVEWIIIALLAGEALLMLVDVLKKSHT